MQVPLSSAVTNIIERAHLLSNGKVNRGLVYFIPFPESTQPWPAQEVITPRENQENVYSGVSCLCTRDSMRRGGDSVGIQTRVTHAHNGLWECGGEREDVVATMASS